MTFDELMADVKTAEGSNTLDAMMAQVKAAEELLPAWFVGRMMTDDWTFALHLITGRSVGISRIRQVRRGTDGAVWLDVDMLRPGDLSKNEWGAPTSRLEASINAAHVVMAYELADT